MKRLLIGALVSGMLALPAFAALKNGQTAPDFKAKASLAGKEFEFSLADALKKGPVVVFFYPAAFTGGCNIEANAFATNKEKFEAVNTTIIGVSRDPISRLHEFSSDPEYCAGKFPVASDVDGSITKAFELNTMNLKAPIKDSRGVEIEHTEFTERTTFVITPDSKIIATLSSADDKITPADHMEKSLALVESLKK